MGVNGLWTVVAPTARPTQLATLNRKRLAVDASIWIYQFLKAVRDKEGNALRNSHVVGFFRRICKLLYFGIKPVFVFDGGAPVLKRETVRRRARRREGRREDAARTAGKLLAVQVARAAEEEEKRKRAERERTPDDDELPPEQELVYVDELGMTQKERQAGRTFKRKDQYHLPDLDVSIESLGAPNDPRIMSQTELEEYARQFHSGEDINLYDFSKIDFESPFFLSLPAGDRYNILNAARLRSRLRMGYSKEQLDGMFPDRMAFSKFQIERVKERNELTQRLMHVNGMAEDFLNQGGRIAGEKGKEYILVKNEGVEGGWALGVVSNKQGSKKENAIDLDEEEALEEGVDAVSDDEEDFEDVAIEGLNRIPKIWQRKRKEVDYDISYEDAAAQIARKRKAVYDARKEVATGKNEASKSKKPEAIDTGGLFVPQDQGVDEEEQDALFEDVNIDELPVNEEDDELQQAIAMSLEIPLEGNDSVIAASAGDIPGSTESKQMAFDDNDDGLDLQRALAESRKSKYQSKTNVRKQSPPTASKKFDGPLPFESLNLGQSLLGKKKLKKVEEDLSGGFDRQLGDDTFRKERPAQPLPSWFEAAPKTNDLRRPQTSDDDGTNEESQQQEEIRMRELLRRQATKDVIDVDAEDETLSSRERIDISSDEEIGEQKDGASQERTQETLDWELPDDVPEDVDAQQETKRKHEEEAREARYQMGREIAAENESQKIRMDDVAERTQATPTPPTEIPTFRPASVPPPSALPFEEPDEEEDQIEVEWSESDNEAPEKMDETASEPYTDAGKSEDEEDTFEDVEIVQPPTIQRIPDATENIIGDLESKYLLPADDDGREPQEATATEANGEAGVEFDYLSDSDEELMRQLAIEAEEHARFASSLNNSKTPTQAARDYENELKQLRNQQKKDRRDADEVTQTMIQECQALLRLFGLPYLTAPMEAEAQCAELVHLGLVDGIVTDDSDIFLFGGTRIYKNMFNAAKFVECYLATDLEKEYALDRRKLIRFAHLLGSDYTEGIPGVGPVTALEILTDFSTLEDFKEWCSKVQLGRAKDLENQLTTPFRRKFRNTAQKRLFLPTGFPDVRVDNAYLEPEVDSNPEEFQWGVPDLDKLRSFLMATIGWNQDRTDEILVPVIRDMNKRETEGTQANITRFFAGGVGVGAVKEGAAPRNRTGAESGRMKNAYTRLRGEAQRKQREFEDEEPDRQAAKEDGGPDQSEKIEKPQKQKQKRKPALSDESDGDDESYGQEMKKSKKSRRIKNK